MVTTILCLLVALAAVFITVLVQRTRASRTRVVPHVEAAVVGVSDPLRGQIAKIIVLSAVHADPTHWALENPPTATFQDVAVGSTFFTFVQTAVSHGVLSGYSCGAAPAGPCVPPGNKPYFLPVNNATRAQVSKITYLASTFGRSR